MLKKKVRKKPKQTRIPQTLTYSRFCPNISKVIRKLWNLLELNESLKEIFNCRSITAFRRNKNLKELIERNKIENNKVKKRQIQKLKPGKCSRCLKNLRSLCCKQVRKTTTFKSQQTKKTRYSTSSTVPVPTLYI